MAGAFSGKDELSPGELHALGIETVMTKTYLWGGFRYSNARDAVAAVKRNSKS